MSLTSGSRIGPYEILAPLGAGGMGEVYRARDTKLNREVAIKILPQDLAAHPERLARFRREAQVLASLNHPNIAAIYGLEDGALIMELVEGESPRGPMPVERALEFVRQLAEALDYAHEKGIVHRDLKPANIKVTPEGRIKVLDFGLAKAISPDVPSESVETIDATQQGAILGTVGYMAPEQARGEAVDKRADIWAFGVVLHEMLSGQRLYSGRTAAETFALVMLQDPSLEKLPAETPQNIRRLLRRCLRKDRNSRLRDIGDVRVLLEDSANETAGPAQTPNLKWTFATVVLVLALAAAGVGWWRATHPVSRALMRFDVELEPAARGDLGPTILSPDGTRLVFRADGPDGEVCLYTRSLDQPKATLIPGTEKGRNAFFSPDGEWIGFFANGQLKKVSIAGGTPLALAAAPDDRGGSWSEDGNIAFAPNISGPLWRVSSAGGSAVRITEIAKDKAESTHRWPQFLANGRLVLFTVGQGLTFDDATTEVLSLENGRRWILQRGGYYGRYVSQPGSPATGYLLYVRADTLFAAPMNLDRLELTGPPIGMVDGVANNPGSASAQFDLARTGMLVFRSGKTVAPARSIAWLHSSGKVQSLPAAGADYSAPRISPDGGKIVLALHDGGDTNLVLYDWARNTFSKLTFTHNNSWQVWAPDGKHLAVGAERPGAALAIEWIRSDGSGEAQLLMKSGRPQIPCSFSPDGKYLAYNEEDPETGWDIWIVPLDLADPDHPRVGNPEPFLRTKYVDGYPVFSPDGRWLAYSSNESGRQEIYVRPFKPESGASGKVPLSSGGGSMPVWSRSGSELFYSSPAGITAISYVVKNDTFIVGDSRVWTAMKFPAVGFPRPFDTGPDGKRIVVLPAMQNETQLRPPTRVTFLVNFFDELRRKAPAKN